MALLRTRQHAPFQGDATCVAAGETAAMAAAALAAEDAAIAVVPTAPGKKLVKQVPVASFGELRLNGMYSVQLSTKVRPNTAQGSASV